MKQQIAIYLRLSLEDVDKRTTKVKDESNSIASQRMLINRHLDQNPLLCDLPRIEFCDDGFSGTNTDHRQGFQKLMKDAMDGKIDMIITKAVSRFARNTVDTLQYTRSLKAQGVEVFFINDNIRTFDGDGELRLTIMATLAQDESRKTSIRVKSGQQTSMENGVFYGNGNILGYDRIETIFNGKK